LFFLSGLSQESPHALGSYAITLDHVPVVEKDTSGINLNFDHIYINNNQPTETDEPQEIYYDYPIMSGVEIKTDTAHAYAYSENLMCLENVITPNDQKHAMQVGPAVQYENQHGLENDGESFSMTKCVVYNIGSNSMTI